MTFRFRYALALVLAASLASSLSCGHDQQLVSISIVPDTETFGASTIPVSDDAGLTVQLRALGQFIHPPVTKDITDQVTWGSNTPDMVTVNSTGLISATGLSCGGTVISATVQKNSSDGGISSAGAIVTGSMQANVVCFTGTGGGGGSGPILTVDFAGGGTGSVTFTPSGFSCASSCGVSFASGTAVNVAATPNSGFSFTSWTGCDSASTNNQCIINSLTADRTVTVTFN
jgi:Divergent InlB B-repeat domain/Bacterial Ig-like domain (group 2)